MNSMKEKYDGRGTCSNKVSEFVVQLFQLDVLLEIGAFDQPQSPETADPRTPRSWETAGAMEEPAI